MADQVTVDNGEGTDYVVSTDDAGASGQVQRVKLAYSADGVATHVPADADGVLVNLGTNNDVTVSGVSTAAKQDTIIGHIDGVEALLAAIQTAVETIDNIVAGSEAQVDVITMPNVAVTQSGTWDEVGVNDSGNSLTVDAPVATPVFVRLSDGSAAITTLPVSAAALPLPSGASTEATLVTIDGRVDGLEGGVGAAADAAATVGSTGSLTAKLRLMTSQLDSIKTAVETLDNTVSGNEIQADVLTLPALPAGNNNIGDVDAVQSGTWTVQPGNTANTTAWLVKEQRATTATCTQIADSASSGQFLASTAGRLGASIQNTSSAVLYVKLGTTASVTDFSARLVQYSYYEVPYGYTGRIDGIWASDPGDGAAVITELT